MGRPDVIVGGDWLGSRFNGNEGEVVKCLLNFSCPLQWFDRELAVVLGGYWSTLHSCPFVREGV